MYLTGGLEKRVLGVILIWTLFFSSVAAAIAFDLQYRKEFANAQTLMDQLVIATEASAAVAAYAKAPRIADEVIQSLLKSDYIAQVRIDSVDGFEREGRRAAGVDSDQIGIYEPDLSKSASYPLYAPLGMHAVVGHITVALNQPRVRNQALTIAGLYSAMVGVQSFVLAALIGMIFRKEFTRPILRLAHKVSALEVGKGQRLRIAERHHNDEIGLLYSSINSMAASADDTLHQLGVQREKAHLATLAKSRFLASASHDLRQPMHALNMYLGVMAEQDLPEKTQRLLRSAQQCGQSMDDMFRAFLDISRLDAGVVQPQYATFPIQKLLDQVVLEFAQAAQAKGLQLRVAACSAVVRTDFEQFKNIVRNLISNAVRYTDHGKVLVGCRRKAGRLRLEVWDTGRGLTSEQKGRIFEEFYQVGNKERNRAMGQGLGLAIVERLANLLRAPLAVHSRPGHGSCFAISLPLQTPTTELEKPEDQCSEEDLAGLNGAMVVVIDDEEAILNATRNVLEQAGSEVVVALSGEEAIRLLARTSRQPNVLVCDYRLADGSSGVNAIESLRDEFAAEIPALLITGETDPACIQALKKCGLGVLHKPLQAYELRRAVAMCMARHKKALKQAYKSAQSLAIQIP
jgi:signal transduction histidine kinase/FixJ family two-component response regulator